MQEFETFMYVSHDSALT